RTWGSRPGDLDREQRSIDDRVASSSRFANGRGAVAGGDFGQRPVSHAAIDDSRSTLWSRAAYVADENQPHLVEHSRVLALCSRRVGQGADCLTTSAERVATDPRLLACANQDQ